MAGNWVPPSSASRRVVSDTRWRDALLAAGAGAVVLAFVLWAVFSLGRQANSAGGVEGVIVGKEFVARPETQITVGQGGVHSQRKAGDYILHVKVPQENGKTYDVFVDPAVYASRKEGERFYFVKPRG